MRHKILQIDDANMAGFEWSYTFWLSRARDRSLTLTLTQSARGEIRRDIEPTTGIAGGVALYRALDEMMSEVGYALEESNVEEAAKAIERLGVEIAAEFRSAQRVVAAQDATGLPGETDRPRGGLADDEVETNRSVRDFVGTKPRLPDAGSAPNEDEPALRGTVHLPEPIQSALDEAAAGMTTCALLAGDPAIQPVTAWLEDEDHLTDALCTESLWVHVVSPDMLADAAGESSVHARSNSDRAALVRRGLARALSGDHDIWGLEYPVRVRVPVVTSTGERLVFGCRFSRFDDSPIVEWDGLFASDDTYRRWLRSKGSFTCLSDFDALPLATRAAFLGPKIPSLPERPFCCYIPQDSSRVPPIQVPKRRPTSAKFVGQVEWAWSAAHSRSDHLYLSLSSDRKYWLLWHEWHDEYGDQSRAGAFTRCGGSTPEEAAAALVDCYYRGEQEEFVETEGPWDVVAAGILSIVELTRIAAVLWPPTIDPSPNARFSRPRGSQCRYFAVEEVVPLGESAWTFESESLEEAFDAYMNQVATSVASGHGTGLVFLFDRKRRRVVTSTEGGSCERAVDYWLP